MIKQACYRYSRRKARGGFFQEKAGASGSVERDWKMIRAGLVWTWNEGRSASASKVSSDKGMV